MLFDAAFIGSNYMEYPITVLVHFEAYSHTNHAFRYPPPVNMPLCWVNTPSEADSGYLFWLNSKSLKQSYVTFYKKPGTNTSR
jgi:hypothetical protein